MWWPTPLTPALWRQSRRISMSSRAVLSTQEIPGQPGLHNETLPQTGIKNRTKGEMGVTSKYQLGSSWDEHLGTFAEVQSLQLARRFPGSHFCDSWILEGRSEDSGSDHSGRWVLSWIFFLRQQWGKQNLSTGATWTYLTWRTLYSSCVGDSEGMRLEVRWFVQRKGIRT